MKERVDPYEFQYEGYAVGIFDYKLPDRSGFYGYEPIRGIGHIKFSKALKSGLSVECCYFQKRKRKTYMKVTFKVSSINDKGQIAIDNISECS